MSKSNRFSFARESERWVTIKEILSADPKVKDKNYVSANGINVKKIIFLGIPENISSGEKASTAVVVDGGKIAINVTGFGEEHAPTVEGMDKTAWSIIIGTLRWDKKKDYFYVTPTHIETVSQDQRMDAERFWFLSIILMRIKSGQLIPKDPCSKVLDSEKIPYEEVDGEWLKINVVETPKPQRVINRKTKKEVSEDEEEWGTMKIKAISFLQQKDKTKYGEYLEWAGTQKINDKMAEDLIIELSNEGKVKEVDGGKSLAVKS